MMSSLFAIFELVLFIVFLIVKNTSWVYAYQAVPRIVINLI